MKQQTFNDIVDKIAAVDAYLYDVNYHLPNPYTVIWIFALSIIAYLIFRVSTKHLKNKAKAKRKKKDKHSTSNTFGKQTEEKNKYRDKEEREAEHILKRIKMFVYKMMEKDRAKSINDSLPNLPEISRRQERTQERSEERERTQERTQDRDKGQERAAPDRQNPDQQRGERAAQHTPPSNITAQPDSQRHSRPEANRHEPHKHIHQENQRRDDRRIPFMPDARYIISPRLDLNPISNMVNLMAGKLMPMQDLMKVPTPLHVQPATNPVLRPESPAQQTARAQSNQPSAPQQRPVEAQQQQQRPQPQQPARHQEVVHEPQRMPANMQQQFVALRCTVTQQFTRLNIGFDARGAVESIRMQTISVTREFFAYTSKQNDVPQQEPSPQNQR